MCLRILLLASFTLLTCGFAWGDDKTAVAEPPKAKSPAKPDDKPKTPEAKPEKPAKAEDKAKAKTDPAKLKKALSESKRFLRITNNDKGVGVAMQTSIIRYQSPRYPGVTVDLIGVVHIGDKDYYEKLNKIFTQYDALLYELVAPEGTRPIPGQRGDSMLSGMQRMMKDTLELQFQLDVIDYSKENFVHADMSPSEFAESMNERGESFGQLFLRMMGQSMAQQGGGGSTDLQFLMALMSRNRSSKLKRVMAKQFQEMEATMYALNGPNGTTIINERNKKALGVMSREIDAGKRRLAIFYGAGHLPDMERRLEGDFGFRPKGSQWLTAWDLTK